MNTRLAVLALVVTFLVPSLTNAATHFVNTSNATPSFPYTTWGTAAVNIQDAVDAAASGDEILVTNGVYETGGRIGSGSLSNRLVITKQIAVLSVNGASFTTIRGYQVPGMTNGDNAVRCVYLYLGSLGGFTLCNGATRATGGNSPTDQNSGGGLWCSSYAVISNCVLLSNSAYMDGGGAYSGILTNCTIMANTASNGAGAASAKLTDCVISGNLAWYQGGGVYGSSVAPAKVNNCILSSNTAYQGGGGASFTSGTMGRVGCALQSCTLLSNSAMFSGGAAYSCTLNDCNLTGNSSPYGGGADEGSLTNCVLTANSSVPAEGTAVFYSGGGGASYATLSGCTVISNSAAYGGGVRHGNLDYCKLTGNSASYAGGGSYYGVLNNCVVSGNSAVLGGGGTCGGSLKSCTLSGNAAQTNGGGSSISSLSNCIVYYNTAPSSANFRNCTFSYCCTYPLPSEGSGNISNEPAFVDFAGGDFRLASNSPCINAGRNSYLSGALDFGGNSRIMSGTVDIGAYEYQGIGSVISYDWLQQYGLPTDGSTDYLDSDGDGLNNYQEWRCSTNPTNALSALRIVAALPAGSNVVVVWNSVSGVGYVLERNNNLSLGFTPLASGIPGQFGTTTYTDTNAGGTGQFYRVGVAY